MTWSLTAFHVAPGAFVLLAFFAEDLLGVCTGSSCFADDLFLRLVVVDIRLQGQQQWLTDQRTVPTTWIAQSLILSNLH